MTKRKLIDSLDVFTKAYIECALWSSTDNADDSGGEPLDKNFGIDDLSMTCLRRCQKDCAEFQSKHADLMELYVSHRTDWNDPSYNAQYSSTPLDATACAGHDFWLTRNHHGAGFWDRGLPNELGEKLTKAAHDFGECNLEVYRKKIYAL